MAWESIEHTCGHPARHQVYGKRDAREREMRGLSASPCPDCLAVELATERQKASEAAAAAAVETGLPALVGTEKQIAWAERIRADLLADPGNNVPLTLDRIQAHARITAELA